MKMRRKNFTLFEMLISASLLIVLTVILLRMFALTSDYWHYSEGKSNVYIDNKILFNLLNDELSNMIYDYSNAAKDDAFHAPLYIGESNHNSSGTIKYPKDQGSGSYTSQELTKYQIISFVTRTKRDSDAEHSDIAKVAYVFFPPLKDNSNGHSLLDNTLVPGQKNGVVVRMILNEKTTTKFTGNQNIPGKGNTQDYYRFDSQKGKQVIDNVLDFSVTAYKYASDNKTLEEAKPDADGYSGIKDARAIVVTMTMLPPDKMTEFKLTYQDKSETEQKDFLQKYARTFRRTFWISPMNSAD